MKHYTSIFAFSLLLAAPHSARADELAPATQQRAESLSGAVLQKAMHQVQITTPVDVKDRAERLRQSLERRSPDLSASWETQELAGTRLRFRRPTTPLPGAGYVMPQAAALVKSANDAATRVLSAGILGQQESLVPVSTGGEVLLGGAPNRGPMAAQIQRHRVTFRRVLGGVPVLGRLGEVDVWLDTGGGLSEVELDAVALSEDGAALAAVDGGVEMKRMFTKAGFDRAPTAIATAAQRGGKPTRIADVLCGYDKDEGDGRLHRGCVVYTVDATSRISHLRASE